MKLQTWGKYWNYVVIPYIIEATLYLGHHFGHYFMRYQTIFLTGLHYSV